MMYKYQVKLKKHLSFKPALVAKDLEYTRE